MSSSIVRKSLSIVDSDFSGKGKLLKKNKKKAQKDILTSEKKITVTELRRKNKSKDQIQKENLEKLKLIQEICTVELPENITKKIIERGVTKKPIHIKEKPKKVVKTAFTEEDFEKFEREYFNE
ncbi:hypothetical protein FQA39_LY06582 [Lamprigera yunnana]|nr:hypothetical protein FQA39_LY06582 [Lamprigera yunnana]